MATRKTASKTTGTTAGKTAGKSTSKTAGKTPGKPEARAATQAEPAPGNRAVPAAKSRTAAVAQSAAVPSTPVENVQTRSPRAAQAPSGETRYRWIAHAAYLRAEKRGFAPGQEVEDWLAAEAEFLTAFGLSQG
jgi:Protein of unknown function (DUF2934)